MYEICVAAALSLNANRQSVVFKVILFSGSTAYCSEHRNISNKTNLLHDQKVLKIHSWYDAVRRHSVCVIYLHFIVIRNMCNANLPKLVPFAVIPAEWGCLRPSNVRHTRYKISHILLNRSIFILPKHRLRFSMKSDAVVDILWRLVIL